MRLAIIGAGVAGLGAAYALRQAGCDAGVVVFEKSRGLSGRATTRRRHGARYDHGAQYAKPPADHRVHRLLAKTLPADDLVDIKRAVWPFDADGTIHPEDARTDGAPKWTYRPGIAHVGKLLGRATPDLTVHTQTRVGLLRRDGAGWRLADEDGRSLGRFDRVLLTPPAPQSADLLDASTGEDAARARLAGLLREVSYRSQFALVFGFDRGIPRREAYALVDTSGQYPIAWLAVESDKPGRAPEGHAVLIAQMSDAWTQEHYDADLDALTEAVWPHLVTLLGDDPGLPAWTDRQRWRYSLPDGALDPDALPLAHAIGLDLAGDFVAGEGRVHRALETGLDAGERLAAVLTA